MSELLNDPRRGCRNADPTLFFGSGAERPSQRRAREAHATGICWQVCPTEVRDACLEFALRHNETDGVWGGFTAEQRARLSRGQPVGVQGMMAL